MPKQRSAASGGLAALLSATAALLLLAGGALWLLGGALPPGTALGGAWTLTRVDGRTVSDRDFRGRFLLIYFGYTRCPDLCPTTLNTVEAAIRQLGSKADRLQAVFISVDPQRDTPQAVGRYVESFGPDLVGLTGTAAQLRAVQQEFRVRSTVVRSIVRHGPGREDEAIDHTSVLFLVGPDGRTLAPLAADATPGQLATRLSPYLL